MKKETEEILEGFYEIDWFENCGTCDDPDMAPVQNLHKAEKFYNSIYWANERTRIMNRFRELYWPQIRPEEEEEKNKEFRRDRFAVGKFTGRIGDSSFKNLPGLKDPVRTRKTLQSDLTAIICEIDSKDIVEPIFFYPVLYPWYMKGFMPCGREAKEMIPEHWTGSSFKDLPEWKLRVF